jgi:hypothetical protein
MRVSEWRKMKNKSSRAKKNSSRARKRSPTDANPIRQFTPIKIQARPPEPPPHLAEDVDRTVRVDELPWVRDEGFFTAYANHVAASFSAEDIRIIFNRIEIEDEHSSCLRSLGAVHMTFEVALDVALLIADKYAARHGISDEGEASQFFMYLRHMKTEMEKNERKRG